MNWNLPGVLQKSRQFFKPTASLKPSQNGIVHDFDDDLGVNTIKEKRDVPFKRMEMAIKRFVDVALPVDLDRLRKHKINICKWRSAQEHEKLQVEYENSSMTIRQITKNITEMDTLRARVLENELELFDYHLKPSRTKALEAVEEFITLREGLARIEETFTSKPETPHSKISEHFNHNHSSIQRATVQGNQLLLYDDLDDVESETLYNEPSISVVQDQLPAKTTSARELESWKKLEKDMTDLHEMMHTMSSMVHEQGRCVDDISTNVEEAGDNIQEGTSQLKKATVLKAAMFPLIGAAVGGAIGGPIGMFAGFKLGSVTTGLAAAGVTGTVIGYQSGKALKKRQNENNIEMKELRTRNDSETSTGSFEVVGRDNSTEN